MNLHKKFPRLGKEAQDLVVLNLRENINSNSCDCCKDYVFSDQNVCEANDCPFKNRQIRDLLIESHIPLVRYIVKRLAYKDYEDCLSIGLLALIKAVDHIPTLLPDSNISGYIRVWVTGDIKNFILTNTIIRVPATANPWYNFIRYLVNSNIEFPSSPAQQTQVDINECLEKIPTSLTSKIILRCILEGGYSGKDMAKKCNVTTAHISQIKKRLEKQMLEILK